MSQEVKFIHCTPEAEKLIAYCARVSSPNQENPEISKLLAYCIKNKHWSVFEMGTLCVEIITSRAIAQQILRHRSFHFQEFSQRYAKATEFMVYEARRQDDKNRQNSIDDLEPETKIWFENTQRQLQDICSSFYEQALKMNIAKEQARFILPLGTQTKLYMHGTLRDWIHYINLRSSNGTQLEHRDIALRCKTIFTEQFPTIAKALEWNN